MALLLLKWFNMECDRIGVFKDADKENGNTIIMKETRISEEKKVYKVLIHKMEFVVNESFKNEGTI